MSTIITGLQLRDLYTFTDNSVLIKNCIFISSRAGVNGGAVYFNKPGGILNVTDSYFINVSATKKGCIYFDSSSYCNIDKCSALKCWGDEGDHFLHKVHSSDCTMNFTSILNVGTQSQTNTSTIENCNFFCFYTNISNCLASQHSSFSLGFPSQLRFLTISSTKANFDVLRLYSGSSIENMNFYNNSITSGSFITSTQTTSLTSCYFKSNSGGSSLTSGSFSVSNSFSDTSSVGSASLISSTSVITTMIIMHHPNWLIQNEIPYQILPTPAQTIPTKCPFTDPKLDQDIILKIIVISSLLYY